MKAKSEYEMERHSSVNDAKLAWCGKAIRMYSESTVAGKSSMAKRGIARLPRGNAGGEHERGTAIRCAAPRILCVARLGSYEG